MEQSYCCATGPCGGVGPAGLYARTAWRGELANRVYGHEPSQMMPGLQPGDFQFIFSRQLMRPLWLVHGWIDAPGRIVSHQGIRAHRLTIAPTELLSGSVFFPNNDYYQFSSPNGTTNISNCAASQVRLRTPRIVLR